MKITHSQPLGLYHYKAYIANEVFAKSLLRNIRWPKGISCPRCQQKHKIWKSSQDYLCGHCSYHFSVTSKTIFARSHLTVSQWVIAIGLFKIGVNGLGLQWAIGCHYRTARRVLGSIRQAVLNDPLIAQLSGEAEVDEAYYGGKRKGLRGRSAKGKTIVLGFKQRAINDQPAKVKTIVIPNVEEYTLNEAISRYVKESSKVYSDGFRGYNSLGANGYQHLPFDHTVKFIKTDVVHTQGIESYWGVTKPITKSRYRKITKKNMPFICAENDFKFNHRENPDFICLVLKKLLNLQPLNA
jgi:transposase